MTRPLGSFSEELQKRGVSADAVGRLRGLVPKIEVFSDDLPTFVGNTLQYLDFLAELEGASVTDLGQAVLSQIPALYARIIPWPGYKIREKNYGLGPLEPGDMALYWNGINVELKAYDPVAERLAEFEIVAARAMAMKPTSIIDFGAGFGFFSLYLAHIAPNLRVLNIERDLVAAVTSRLLVERFRLEDRVRTIVADIKHVSPGMWNAVRRYAPGRAVLTTRAALHPYFLDDQYRAIFTAFLNEAMVVGGAHSELTGHLSPAFTTLQRQLGGALQVSPDYTQIPSNPYAVLTDGSWKITADIQGLPPQFLHDRFISRLFWQKDGDH